MVKGMVAGLCSFNELMMKNFMTIMHLKKRPWKDLNMGNVECRA